MTGGGGRRAGVSVSIPHRNPPTRADLRNLAVFVPLLQHQRWNVAAHARLMYFLAVEDARGQFPASHSYNGGKAPVAAPGQGGETD